MSTQDKTQQRRFARTKTMLDARILLDSGRATIGCTVRNISEGGALLVLDQSAMVPEFFQLSIPSRRAITNSRIAWRSGLQIGVEFITQATLGGMGGRTTSQDTSRSMMPGFLLSLSRGERICLALALTFALITLVLFATG